MYSSATTSKGSHAVTQPLAQIRAAPRCGVVLTWYVPIAQTTLSMDDEYGANISVSYYRNATPRDTTTKLNRSHEVRLVSERATDIA